ncbi:hypothetical protein EMGBS4_06060 [Acidimicrobiaceae bacterium]|nr:hypothetical protein EMGBS4_06060 [Acidimicrobiaceae bacterium]
MQLSHGAELEASAVLPISTKFFALLATVIVFAAPTSTLPIAIIEVAGILCIREQTSTSCWL